MNPFIEFAISVRELLAPPGAWIQGRLSVNLGPDNEIIPGQQPRFCLLGAAEYAIQRRSEHYVPCIEELCAWFGVETSEDLVDLNDNPFMTQGVIVGRLNEIINGLLR